MLMLLYVQCLLMLLLLMGVPYTDTSAITAASAEGTAAAPAPADYSLLHAVSSAANAVPTMPYSIDSCTFYCCLCCFLCCTIILLLLLLLSYLVAAVSAGSVAAVKQCFGWRCFCCFSNSYTPVDVLLSYDNAV